MHRLLDFPIVRAPSGTNREVKEYYRISQRLVRALGNQKKRTPLFQLWGHVARSFPPIPNIDELKNEGFIGDLEDSVACFMGLFRPHNHEEQGESVLIYVLNPSSTIKFDPLGRCMACVCPVPADAALTVHVVPENALQEGGLNVSGVVSRIEFVPSSGLSPRLPVDFGSRYMKRCW